jgi:ribosome maturation factor RimP
MNDELERVVTSELDAVGFDLVELRKGGTRSRPVLEVRIDRRDGEKITVDDCARASRALEARLDGGTLVAERYVLQVSSPGERPIRTAAEWRRFAGRWASLLAPEHGGRFEAEILGVEESDAGPTVMLRLERGEQKALPLSAVKEARLAFRMT